MNRRNSTWPLGDATRLSSWADATGMSSGSRHAKANLCPGKAGLRQWQRTNPLARGGENRVGDGRQNRRQRRLAQPCRIVVRRQEMDFDFRRRLRQPYHPVLMVVGLHHMAFIDGDFL